MRFRSLIFSSFIVGHLAASSGSAAPVVPEIIRGPYLQMPTTESIVVKWRTDVAASSGVFFGTDPDALTELATSSVIEQNHSVQLTDLEPATRYFYRIGDESTPLDDPADDKSFRTAPGSSGETAFRAWIFGDSGLPGVVPGRVQDAYYDFANDEAPDVWLILGDNAYFDGTDAEYQEGFFEPFARTLARTPVWSALGNHDEVADGPHNDYFDFFEFPTNGEVGGIPSGTESYYSFDYAHVHFIALDSYASSRHPNGSMLQWLGQDLAATTQDWIVAFWHHPPYSKGSHDSDAEIQSIEMRQNANSLLESRGVDFVFTGHSHSYERSYLLDGHYGSSGELEPEMILDATSGNPEGLGPYAKPSGQPHEGTVYAVVGTGSVNHPGPFGHPAICVEKNAFGSVVLEVEGERVDGWFIDDSGQELDRFAVVKFGASGVEPSARSSLSLQVAPHPVGASSRVVLQVPRAGRVALTVHDASGREISELYDGPVAAGTTSFAWDGEAESGQSAGPGVCFVRANTEGGAISLKVVRVP